MLARGSQRVTNALPSKEEEGRRENRLKFKSHHARSCRCPHAHHTRVCVCVCVCLYSQTRPYSCFFAFFFLLSPTTLSTICDNYHFFFLLLSLSLSVYLLFFLFPSPLLLWSLYSASVIAMLLVWQEGSDVDTPAIQGGLRAPSTEVGKDLQRAASASPALSSGAFCGWLTFLGYTRRLSVSGVLPLSLFLSPSLFPLQLSAATNAVTDIPLLLSLS